MGTRLDLSSQPTSLGRHLALVSVRERGVGPEQMRWIGVDPDIFEAFYREHVEGLQRFIARRVSERERAADLTAEIFLAAIESAEGYQPGRGTPRAWLYGIARVVIANDARRRDAEREREDRWRASALLDSDDAARIDARIDAAARSRELYAAMDRLPEAERAVLELVALDELSVAEAAAVAGLRPVTARVRLHRARRKLRAELEAANQTSQRKEERP
ncbi:MAG TPA: RNA polymerase sigma factor [Solirubrobacterales bacterium]|nr:RNA polymerase sigma factor [Solirubrobacterales bacterium]